MKDFGCKSLAAGCAALAFSLFAPAASHADTSAFTLTGTAASTPAASGLSGFLFRVNQTIQLTQLGFYAQSISGGDTPHVTLENFSTPTAPSVIYDTGNILSRLTPGGNGTINYVSVGTPITLVPGITYGVVAPAYFAAQYADSTSGIAYSSVLTNTQFYHTGSPGWSGWDLGPDNYSTNYNFPTGFAATSMPLITADFQYTVAGVPEPATCIGSFVACAALLLFGRRRFRGGWVQRVGRIG